MRIARIACFVGLTFSVVCGRLAEAGTTGQQDLQATASELYNSDPTARAQATAKLIKVGPSAVPVLLPVLCDASKPNSETAWRSAAEALGELRAEAAVPCLVRNLAAGDLTQSVFKPTEVIAEREPSFVALIKIGEPAIPAIQRYLPMLHPDQAYLALRVLLIIGTPTAKSAVNDYIRLMENQTRLAKEILAEFK